MKVQRLIVAILIVFASFVASLRAQLNIGSPVVISNVNNFATFQSNTAYVYFPPVTAYLSSVTNTNCLFIGSYMATLVNSAGSNVIAMASITNNFVLSTNNTNVVIPAVTIPLPLFFQYQTQVNSNYNMGFMAH